MLDAAGSAFTRPDGLVTSLTLDRYVDSFYQLDLTLRQNWQPNFLRGGELTFGFSVKNLTDSTRGIVYDRNQTDRSYTERSFKVGQSVKFSVTYSFSAL